jgi:hypothetical protein
MIRAIGFLVAVLLLRAGAAQAQSVNAAVNPAATIVVQASGGGVRSLGFGTIAPSGSADTGAGTETNASSAKWEFTGLPKNISVALNFTLPTDLVNGTSNLPVNWNNAGYGSWCARRSTTAVTGCGGAGTGVATFNPSVATSASTTGAGSAASFRRSPPRLFRARIRRRSPSRSYTEAGATR